MFLAIFVVKVLLVPTIKKSKKILTAKIAKERREGRERLASHQLSLARFKGIVVVISLTEQLRLRF